MPSEPSTTFRITVIDGQPFTGFVALVEEQVELRVEDPERRKALWQDWRAGVSEPVDIEEGCTFLIEDEGWRMGLLAEALGNALYDKLQMQPV